MVFQSRCCMLERRAARWRSDSCSSGRLVWEMFLAVLNPEVGTLFATICQPSAALVFAGESSTIVPIARL